MKEFELSKGQARDLLAQLQWADREPGLWALRVRIDGDVISFAVNNLPFPQDALV